MSAVGRREANAPIKNPHAPRRAVFAFHLRDDRLERGHVHGVAAEDFVGEREPLGRDDERDDELLAVGPVIARTERSEIAKGRSLCPQGSAGGRWQ